LTQRSTSRGGSNVREMIASSSQTRDEVKLFEMKFKGQLDKLDEFEREWSHFKTGGSSANTSVTAPASNTQKGMTKMAEVFGGLNTIVEDDFDYSIKVKKTVSKTTGGPSKNNNQTTN
jgi:hypothetical protein